MKNRILALMLCVSMAFTMCSPVSMAAENIDTDAAEETETLQTDEMDAEEAETEADEISEADAEETAGLETERDRTEEPEKEAADSAEDPEEQMEAIADSEEQLEEIVNNIEENQTEETDSVTQEESETDAEIPEETEVLATAEGEYDELVVTEADAQKAAAIEEVLKLPELDVVQSYDIHLSNLDGSADVTLPLDELEIPKGAVVTIYHFLDSADAIEALDEEDTFTVETDEYASEFESEAAAAQEYDSSVSDDTVFVETITAELDEDTNELRFSISSCSTFTVDFHYADAVYSIPGESEILLSDLFETIGYTDHTAEEADNVTFSDESLVRVDRQENDWLLVSLEAFSTEETLTVTFADGETLVVLVTDETVEGYELRTDLESDDEQYLYTAGGYKRYQFFGSLFNPSITSKRIAAFYKDIGTYHVIVILQKQNGTQWSEWKTAELESITLGSQSEINLSSDYYWFEKESTSKVKIAFDTNTLRSIRLYDLNVTIGAKRKIILKIHELPSYTDNKYCKITTNVKMVSESGENRTIYIYVDDEYMNESDTDYYPTRTSISASDLNVTGLTYDGVSYSSSNNTVVASGTTYNVYLYGNYKVKFDANGGTVSSSSTTYTKKDKITLPTPTRTGYTFGGWKVKSLDTTRNNWTTGTTYTASSISAGKYGSVTLEAQWTPINYTITYNANGGTSVSSQSYTIEDSISLPQLTREGFSFKGWKTTSVAGNWTAGTTYTDASITAGQYGNVTLQAQWGAATYSVVFNGNGATHANSTKGGTMSDQSFTYGTAQNLTANAYERKYTVTYDTQGGDEIEPTVVAAEFLGWSTTEAGSKVYEDKQSVQNLTSTDGAIINLYALWSDVRSVELPTLTRENTEDASYTFLGWYTEPEGKGDEITTGAYTPTDDITLYAYWDVRTTLTIQKEFKNGCEEANKDQVFLFAITSPENENFRMTVTVQGDEPVVIHDVPIGTYIVQENTDWSWLYPGDEQSQKQEVSETEHDVVTFTETEWNAYYWLTGFANTVKSIAGIVGGDQSDANE